MRCNGVVPVHVVMLDQCSPLTVVIVLFLQRICRTLYQGMCCEHHNDKSVCRDKFLTCLGVTTEPEV